MDWLRKIFGAPCQHKWRVIGATPLEFQGVGEPDTPHIMGFLSQSAA